MILVNINQKVVDCSTDFTITVKHKMMMLFLVISPIMHSCHTISLSIARVLKVLEFFMASFDVVGGQHIVY